MWASTSARSTSDPLPLPARSLALNPCVAASLRTIGETTGEWRSSGRRRPPAVGARAAALPAAEAPGQPGPWRPSAGAGRRTASAEAAGAGHARAALAGGGAVADQHGAGSFVVAELLGSAVLGSSHRAYPPPAARAPRFRERHPELRAASGPAHRQQRLSGVHALRPASASRDSTIPSNGHGSSTTDLADSTSTTGWSMLTVSPGGDQPAHDLRLGESFAEVGQQELPAHRMSHSQVFSALRMRSGVGR